MDQIAVLNSDGKNELKGNSAKKNVIAGTLLQYIVIKMGEEQYGIDIRYVDNIVRMQNITRVPKVQAYLKGVINLRGEVIPVVSLRLKMGLPADEYTKNTRIIILKTETAGNLGIIVDEVREVVTLGEDSIEKMTHEPKDSKTSFVKSSNGCLV